MLHSAHNPRTLWSDGVCPQCGGTMVLDDRVDVGEKLGWNLGFGLCCTDCGAVRDPLGKDRLIFY